jgi:hypothetical protein
VNFETTVVNHTKLILGLSSAIGNDLLCVRVKKRFGERKKTIDYAVLASIIISRFFLKVSPGFCPCV